MTWKLLLRHYIRVIILTTLSVSIPPKGFGYLNLKESPSCIGQISQNGTLTVKTQLWACHQDILLPAKPLSFKPFPKHFLVTILKLFFGELS